MALGAAEGGTESRGSRTQLGMGWCQRRISKGQGTQPESCRMSNFAVGRLEGGAFLEWKRCLRRHGRRQ